MEDYATQYLGVKRTCQRPATGKLQNGATIKRVLGNRWSDDDLKYILQYQPVAAGMNVAGCVDYYQSGVITEPSCRCTSNPSSKQPADNHAVTIVGY